MDYIKRDLEEIFLEASASFKAVLVTGARQIGKSTMLMHLAENQHRTVVTMDSQRNRTLAKSDPELFFQTFKPPIMIDEIQKAPELFEAIKIICDKSNEKGLFWLTGSQSKRLIDRVQDSLATRLAVLKMYPLSSREKLGLTEYRNLDFSIEALNARQSAFPANDIHETFESIWKGGMPDAQSLNERMLAIFFESYIDNYLMRDAVDDYGVKNTEGFLKLLRGCAAFVGRLINYNDLANVAGVSPNTAKEWVGTLVSMGIIHLMEPYSNNELKRIIKTPKLYFCDTGLAAYLSMWTSKDVLMNGAASGHYYENHVVMELLKHVANNVPRGRLVFYRDRDGKEIDMIFEDESGMHPLEIKKSANPSRTDMKAFSILQKAASPISFGGIICMCAKPFPIDRINSCIPSNLI